MKKSDYTTISLSFPIIYRRSGVRSSMVFPSRVLTMGKGFPNPVQGQKMKLKGYFAKDRFGTILMVRL